MYNNLKQDIYSVFTTANWNATGYAAYPFNYAGAVDYTKPVIKISILPANSKLQRFDFGKDLSGLLILSIFVKAGDGDNTLFSVATVLDSFFEGKTLTNGTQFGPSHLKVMGTDPGNDTLYRGDYTITFKIHGE